MTDLERFYAGLTAGSGISRSIDARLEFAARRRTQEAVEQVGYDSGGIPHPGSLEQRRRLGWPTSIGVTELATWNYMYRDPVQAAVDGLLASTAHREVLLNQRGTFRHWGAGIYRTFKPGDDQSNPLLERWYFVIWLSTGVPAMKAIVATGQNYPDALTASYLVAKYAAPLFLVTKSTIPAVTRDALEALDPSEILVLGGLSVVDASVVAALSGIAPVRRIAGADRYATAAAVSVA